ncbi:MAG: helix-turn-helix domain-containing protein [Planctomycetaceae bacterium]|nr:helix-turn-helix domain-containing protein [Planctomycetaceae bacterium]
MLLTVEQAATQLQVSRSVVYALVERGKLACHRIGLGRGTIRIAQSDLDTYLESCREGDRIEEPTAPRRAKLKHIRLSGS